MSDQGDGVEVIDATPAEVPVAFIPRATQYSDAFASLDRVSLRDVFDSRAVVMRPGLVGPPGFHTTTRELQTCTFERPGASNTTKIPRKRPKEREEKMKNCGGRVKKKREILGPHHSGPHRSGPSGPHPFGAPPFRAPTGFGPWLA